MKEVTFEGDRLRSAVRMGWPVHRCRSFLPAQGLALGTVHLDVLPARPGQARPSVQAGGLWSRSCWHSGPVSGARGKAGVCWSVWPSPSPLRGL